MSLKTQPDSGVRPGQLDLPPGFAGIALRELGDAMSHAVGVAAARGAGTLVWVRRFDTVEFAVVLEPEEPLACARRALYAAMNAAADALAAIVPPEKPITFDWPDTILLDGGIIGGGRLLWPDVAPEDTVPEWLVAGFVLRSIVPLAKGGSLPGAHPLDERLERGTSLASEGIEMLDGAALVSSFARHLMVQVDQWQAAGFAQVGRDYLARLMPVPGVSRAVDTNGDLLTRRVSNPNDSQRRPLLAALAIPRWLDPETHEPWL